MKTQTDSPVTQITAARQIYKLTCQSPDCGNEFSTPIYWRRFCSNACRQADFKRRHKAVIEDGKSAEEVSA